MEEIALNTHSRITKDPNRVKLWDGKGANSRDGHLRYWQSKLEQYKIATPVDRDKITNNKVWNNNFQVPSFETTRNDAHDIYNQFVCYTDGSKITNQTGYGYTIRKYNRTIYDGHGNMGPVSTVFQAEIKAITMVCKTLHQRRNMDIIIRTDSQAAIAAIKAINITSFTVLECKTWLNKLGDKNRVTLAWIQANVGHPGNDQADTLARVGTALADQGVRHHEPASHFNRLLLEKNIEQWQKKWVADPKECKHSKKFIQNVSHCMTKFNKILKNNSDRELVGILIQCITGHCGLRYVQSPLFTILRQLRSRRSSSSSSSGAEIRTTKYLQRLQRCRRRPIHLCVNVRTARPLPHIAQTPPPQQNRTTLPTSSPIERPQRPLLPWTGGGQLALTGSPASASACCYLFPKLIKADV
jgi:ribonuclease HI